MKNNRMRRTAAVAAVAAAASGLAMFAAAPAHAEPAWGDLQTVTPFGEYPQDLQVAVNEDGKAVAAWRRAGGSSYSRTQASVRLPGGTWSTPKNLSKDGKNVLDTEVAINDAGQAVVSWRRKVDGDWRVQLRHLSATGTWGKIRTVSPADEAARYPTVDITPTGAAMVAWSAEEGPSEVRLARVKRDGSKKVWVLSTRRAADRLDLDTNRTGETVVVWPEVVPGADPVRSRRLMNGKLTPKATLAEDGNAVSVSVNDGGDAIAAYHRVLPGDTMGVFANSGVSGGTWGSSKALSDGGLSTNPDTAIAFDGTQVVVWQNAWHQVQATMRELGEPWGESSLIATGSATHDASVAMNDAGDLAIAWTDDGPAHRMLVKPAGESGTFAPAYEFASIVNGLVAHGIDGDGSVVAIHGVKLSESYRLLSRFYDATA